MANDIVRNRHRVMTGAEWKAEEAAKVAALAEAEAAQAAAADADAEVAPADAEVATSAEPAAVPSGPETVATAAVVSAAKRERFPVTTPAAVVPAPVTAPAPSQPSPQAGEGVLEVPAAPSVDASVAAPSGEEVKD